MTKELIDQVKAVLADASGGWLTDAEQNEIAEAVIAAMQPHIAAEREDAAQAERAAVVEFIKAKASEYDPAWSENWDLCDDVEAIATAIEAGEHRA